MTMSKVQPSPTKVANVTLDDKEAKFPEPNIYCKWIVKNPKLAFGIMLACQLTMIIITIILQMAKVPVFNFDVNRFH